MALSAAQIKARARFTKAAKKAKQLRKANPKLSQAEAIKKAFALDKKPAKKAAAPRKKAAKKKVARRIISGVKTKRHTDTKSHNVNIKVVGSIDGMKNLRYLVSEKINTEKRLLQCKAAATDKNSDAQTRAHFKTWVLKYKKYLQSLNKQISIAKKHV